MTEILQLQIAARQNIESTRKNLLNVKLPAQGNFQKIQQHSAIKKAFQLELQQNRNHLANLEKSYASLQGELKSAHIEHEKAKHLEEIEVRRLLAQKKRLDEIEMDEMGMLLYNRQEGA